MSIHRSILLIVILLQLKGFRRISELKFANVCTIKHIALLLVLFKVSVCKFHFFFFQVVIINRSDLQIIFISDIYTYVVSFIILVNRVA